MNPNCNQVFPIYLEFSEDLERYIRSKVGSAEVAKDLTGALALRLYHHCDRLVEVENVRGWLFRLAHNATMDYFRQQGREQQVATEYALVQASETEVNDMAERCAVALLHELPESVRVPLTLADLEGIPQKDIAERLSLNYSTVKMRVQRGRKQLRTLLMECLDQTETELAATPKDCGGDTCGPSGGC